MRAGKEVEKEVTPGGREERGDMKREEGEYGRRRTRLVGEEEEATLEMAWRTVRARSFGLKGGKTKDVPCQSIEKGSCWAPKRPSAGWKDIYVWEASIGAVRGVEKTCEVKGNDVECDGEKQRGGDQNSLG